MYKVTKSAYILEYFVRNMFPKFLSEFSSFQVVGKVVRGNGLYIDIALGKWDQNGPLMG